MANQDKTPDELTKSKNIKRPVYIGMEKHMKCGVDAKIIAIEDTKTITIQFEDGTIKEHVNKYRFLNGSVKYPRQYNTDNDEPIPDASIKSKDLIGVTLKMNCGAMATVIGISDGARLTVQFSDGMIRYGIKKDHFLAGMVAHSENAAKAMIGRRPKEQNSSWIKSKSEMTGMSRYMCCGQKATVIEYRSSSDMDVQFENGKMRYHVSKQQFMAGHIACEDENNEKIARKYMTKRQLIKARYMNQTRKMNCGLKAKVIDYQDCNHLTVEFEDGTIMTNVKVGRFVNRNIVPPHLKKNKGKS